MTTSDDSRDGRTFTLTILGDWAGRLAWLGSDGLPKKLDLPPRLTRMLFVYGEACALDADLDPDLQGFLTNEKCALAYERTHDPTAVTAGAEAFGQYRATLNKLLRRAEGREIASLFQGKPHWGVRLNARLLIVDLRNRRA